MRKEKESAEYKLGVIQFQNNKGQRELLKFIKPPLPFQLCSELTLTEAIYNSQKSLTANGKVINNFKRAEYLLILCYLNEHNINILINRVLIHYSYSY